MVTDPSQSKGLQTSSTAPGLRQDESLHAVPNDAWDAPQVHDPASEGLQSVDYDGRDGLQALDHPAPSPDVAYAHYGDNNAEKAAATVSAGDVAQSRQSRSRKWVWIIVIAVVLVIAIAVGVGVGVGVSHKVSGSDKSSVKDAESTSAGVGSATTSPSSTETPTATTTTSAPVTSGTTGIAGFKCDDSQLTISMDGNAYFQDCGVYYKVDENMLSPDSKSKLRNLPIGANGKSVDPITKYSFEDCINECDKYNANRNATDQACYAVSYYANLDWVFKRWAGNCFLKNGRGYGTSIGDGTEDWKHTASAYKNCLNRENGCG